ncbi:CHASE2 domain-containing protein [Oxynema sp. CENA135]|uniref:CHASE2 domain-containing protein n=1 Tax=Oxynema sp. CENA135 TaxID=984206 RepID=UPI001F17F577|nr:CHASE2 domain-containing protein [Oxynema sp. CENA135]
MSLSVQIEQNGRLIFERSQARLAPNSELQMLYETWSEKFVTLRHLRGWEIDEQLPTNSSFKDDRDACLDLVRRTEASLKNWLIDGGNEHWRTVREELKSQFKIYSHEFYLVIKTNDKLLWKLPWYAWDLLEQYPDVGIGFMLPDFQAPSGEAIADRERVRMLSILGNDRGLNLSPDREAIQGLTNTDPHFLDKPSSRRVIEAIRDKRGWDILFFAGHSESLGDRGRIYINERESLEVYEFKNALQAARDRGLKLAIFNSCQGLALANELASLKIPAIVVMKEAVPDRVAQKFLKEFLTEYSSGKLLQTAVRKAQEALESEGKELPGATWLPIVCQHSGQFTPRWQDLLSTRRYRYPKWRSRRILRKLKTAAIASLLVSLGVITIRSFGWLQPLEMWAYDRALPLRLAEDPDDRIVLVTITDDDLERLNEGESISDATTLKILQKVNQYKPLVIGLNIYRDLESSPGRSELEKYFQESNKNILGVCHFEDSDNYTGSQPPPGLDPKRLTFTNFKPDSDGVIRRHLLNITQNGSKNSCTSSNSLSFQLARWYLWQKDKKIDRNNHNDSVILWGDTEIQLLPLDRSIGSYQIHDGKGSQILLNYRAGDPFIKKINLEQLFNEKNINIFSNKIVIIGYLSEKIKQEFHDLTPYGEWPSLLIHAHKTSQLLSAVENRRPLLYFMPPFFEHLYIYLLSLISAIFVKFFKSKIIKQMKISLVVLFLMISYVLSLNFGLWLPFIPALFSVLATLMYLKYSKK